MTNFIPIFPLNIVVFPNETLNLHIFEPRYKQLINDCVAQKKPFGIVSVLNNAVMEIGTLINVESVVNTYEDGKMDIITKGLKVFRVLETIKLLPEKLYGGVIANYPTYYADGLPSKMSNVISALRAFHGQIQIQKDYKKPDNDLKVHDIVHHAGLSLEEEYEVLCLMHESQQQEYLYRHLKKMIPTIQEIEKTKERIKMNGHFRDLRIEGFDL